MTETTRVAFLCDGSRRIGMGHVMRCLSLADVFSQKGVQVCFHMQEDPVGFQQVRTRGYQVVESSGLKTQGAIQNSGHSLIDRLLVAEVVVLDMCRELSHDSLASLRENPALVVVIDDATRNRLGADLAFYPPVPQVQELEWTHSQTEVHVGWEWVVLGQNKPDSPEPLEMPEGVRLLVSLGGSDPDRLTEKVLSALPLVTGLSEIWVVVGPGRASQPSLPSNFGPSVQIFQGITNLTELMVQVDAAVVSQGLTAFECAACSVPAVYLCLTPDHARSAQALEKAGMGHSAGLASALSPCDLATTLQNMLDRGIPVSSPSAPPLDFKGAFRVADTILARTAEEKRK